MTRKPGQPPRSEALVMNNDGLRTQQTHGTHDAADLM